jgi:hypothetical protein
MVEDRSIDFVKITGPYIQRSPAIANAPNIHTQIHYNEWK